MNNDLELYLLPGKCCDPKFSKIYEQTYLCWKEAWEDAWKNDWKKSKTIKSDDFTRQDEVLAFFYKGECAGLCFFKRVNFSDQSSFDDSYFACWPEIALKRLLKKGNNVVVCCNFTLSTKYRGTSHGINWKFFLASLVAKRFIHLQADAMTGTMRKEKGMEKVTLVAGETICPNVQYQLHGDLVDLIALYRDEVSSYGPSEYKKTIDEMWANKKHCSRLRCLESIEQKSEELESIVA